MFAGESRAYSDPENHHTVNHGDGGYVRGEVGHINGMGSFRAPVGRGYNGTFHHVDPGHLHRYANEFSGRPSGKATGVVERMGGIVRNLVGKKLTCRQLAAGSALCGRLRRRIPVAATESCARRIPANDLRSYPAGPRQFQVMPAVRGLPVSGRMSWRLVRRMAGRPAVY